MTRAFPICAFAAIAAAGLACASKPATIPGGALRPAFPLVEESRVDFEGALLGGPQALGEEIVLSIASGRVLAVSPAEKKILWQFRAKAALAGPAFAGPGFVLVFDLDGRMTKLAGEGKIVWEKSAGGSPSFPPAPIPGGIIAVLDRRMVRALDAETGAERWSWTADEDIRTAARMWGDKAVVLTAGKKAVLLAGGGKAVPLFETAALASGPGLIAGDRLIAGFENGTLEAWDLAAKKRRWVVKTGAVLAADPLEVGGRIFVVTEGRQLFAIEKRSGVVAWWASLPGRAVGGAVLCAARVLAPALSPVLTAYDPATGQETETNDLKGEVIAAPLVLGDRVAVPVRDPATAKSALVILRGKSAPPSAGSKKTPNPGE